MWQRAKSYFTGSAASKRASARVISSVVFQERSRRAREAEVSRQLVDVRVDRQSRTRGRRRRPEPEIDAVGRADHPAQVEEEALRAARAARVGEQVRGAAALARRRGAREPAARRGCASSPGGERLAQHRLGVGELAREARAQRAVLRAAPRARRRRAARCPRRGRRGASSRACAACVALRVVAPRARGAGRGARARRRAWRGSSSRCRTRSHAATSATISWSSGSA